MICKDECCWSQDEHYSCHIGIYTCRRHDWDLAHTRGPRQCHAQESKLYGNKVHSGFQIVVQDPSERMCSTRKGTNTFIGYSV